MTRALLALLLALPVGSCGGAGAGTSTSAVAVGLDDAATVADLVGALSRALRQRGHEGECFLAFDAPRPDVTVRIGARSRSAALSCGGLTGLSAALEGRCPAARIAWVTTGTRPAAVSYIFGPPGDAFAHAPVAVRSAASPAREAALFRAEGARLVLAMELARVAPGASKQAAAPPATPLDDPAVQLAMRQLVARVQRCNPSGEGSLVLEWLALADGTVTGARPLASSVGDDVVRCALDMVNATSFPERVGEAEPIGYCAPVLLAPALRPSRSDR